MKPGRKYGHGASAARIAAALWVVCLGANAGAADSPAATADEPRETLVPAPTPLAPVFHNPAPAPSPLSDQRILGIIPDYQTVNDSSVPVPPLSPRQKWNLFVKSTLDPFNLANAVLASGFSQAGNQTPKYGEGGMAYGKRFGAAIADFATQSLFSGVVLANLLHQDPRYFRRGPRSGVLKRIGYSVSRIAVTRQDSGRSAFNASNIFGMGLGIAASNVYYPAASVRGSVMLCRIDTSLTSSISGNLLSEFWPDIQRKLFHRKHRA